LIHCLSRLDPDVQPSMALTQLPRRFFFATGQHAISLSQDTEDPKEVLKILLVNKRFYFLGVHCFYSTNT